jgi:phage terminase small subunit
MTPKPRKKRPAPKNSAPGKKPGITTQQLRFIELLVVESKSATDAAIGAGYSEKTSAQIGYNLIHKNVYVMDAIKKRREELSMRSLATRERWLEEICRLAFFDPAQLFEDDGSLKRMKDMPEDARRILAGLEVAELFAGSGDDRQAIGLLKKVKLPDKLAGLTLLGKAEGWLVDKRELTGKDGAPLVPAAQTPSMDNLPTELLAQLREHMKPADEE